MAADHTLNRACADARADLHVALIGDDRVIAVTGAGGKKTTMYALAAAAQGRVALSSTAHMYLYDRRRVDAVMTLVGDEACLPATGGARVVAFSGPTETPKRVGGLSPHALSLLVGDGSFDLILLKADGARARWIKAPAPYEPVVPDCAERVIYLVSARAIGHPLDERIAHRPERIAEVTGARLGEPITPGHLARLIASEEGGAKGIGHAHLVPVINAVDGDALRASAREAAAEALALSDRFDRVVLASMQAPRVVEIVSR